MRDVFDPAVAEFSPYDERLPVALPEHRRGRKNLQPHQSRIVGLGGRGAVGDPVGKDPVLERIDRKPQAAAMRQGARRLGQQQAPAGIFEHDPPRSGLPGDVLIIGLGIEAAQAEPKTFLAGQGPMASTELQPACDKTGST